MKIIKNEKLIERKGKIGRWASLSGIILVVIPLFLYTQALINSDFESLNVTLFMALTLGGMVVSQVGMYMGSRYGRSPRPDEKLDAGLKGLPGDFSMYHYVAPASHLLVGPAGIWILMPYHQGGQVTFKKNRWRLSGGGFMQGYMRIFGQEGLGRPDIEIEGEINSLKKFLAKQIDESQIPQVNALIVFTSDAVEIEDEDAPIPALKVNQIKEFMRRKAKERGISSDALNKIKAVLE